MEKSNDRQVPATVFPALILRDLPVRRASAAIKLFQGPVHFYKQHLGSGLANIFYTMRVSRNNR